MQEEKRNNRITLYPDGKYRWVYEVSMMKNPSILIDIFKVLGISLGIVWLFTVLLDIFDDDLSLEKLWNLTMVFLELMLVFAVIGIIAYTSSHGAMDGNTWSSSRWTRKSLCTSRCPIR